MVYDLKNLTCLAQGGEADVYDIGDGKILRVMRKTAGKALEQQTQLMSVLEKQGICTPRVYAYTQVDGRPAQIMQKISGITMLQQMKRHPLGISKEIKNAARLHAQLLCIEPGGALHSIEDTMRYFTAKPPLVTQELRNFTLKIFDELPHEAALCHGDFHPGNILIQDGTDYIIDWTGAYRGHFVSDIAHSYLLMRHVPEIPGQSRVQKSVTRLAGAHIAQSYLKNMSKIEPFDWAQFSKWTVVMSFLRVYYGMPSERKKRIEYMVTCYELNKKSVPAAAWYRKI